MKIGYEPICPKLKGRGTMVSGFLTPDGRLFVAKNISDVELVNDPMWQTNPAGNPIRDYIQFLEYGTDNYWTGDIIVKQTIWITIPIFRLTFPRSQALYALNNASNHYCLQTINC